MITIKMLLVFIKQNFVCLHACKIHQDVFTENEDILE